MPDLGNWGQCGSLTDKAPQGALIDLRCKNHPNLRWMTKNLAPIGARSIFFCGDAESKGDVFKFVKRPDGCDGVEYVKECDCPAEDLEVVPEA